MNNPYQTTSLHFERNTHQIGVTIIADQPSILERLRALVADHRDSSLVCAARFPQQLLTRAVYQRTDVVLLLTSGSDAETATVLRKLTAGRDAPGVLVVSGKTSRAYADHIRRAGGSGVLPPDAPSHMVHEAINMVARGEPAFGDTAENVPASWSPSDSPTRLTSREVEVLKLLCREYTSKEIAGQLFISYRTVEGHRRSMQEKTGARNIVGLVLYAVRHGLV